MTRRAPTRGATSPHEFGSRRDRCTRLARRDGHPDDLAEVTGDWRISCPRPGTRATRGTQTLGQGSRDTAPGGVERRWMRPWVGQVHLPSPQSPGGRDRPRPPARGARSAAPRATARDLAACGRVSGRPNAHPAAPRAARAPAAACSPLAHVRPRKQMRGPLPAESNAGTPASPCARLPCLKPTAAPAHLPAPPRAAHRLPHLSFAPRSRDATPSLPRGTLPGGRPDIARAIPHRPWGDLAEAPAVAPRGG